METTNSCQPKTAVVTGSSTGIGKAIAIEFAEAGYNLVLHGRSESEELTETKRSCLERIVQRKEQVDAQVNVQTCDFLQAENFSGFFNEVVAQVGSIDVWINNAGIDVLTGDKQDRSFDLDLQQLFDVDVRATLLLSRLAGEHMKDSRINKSGSHGSIINIGWDQAVTGICGESGQMFGATKGAVMAMTSSLARSFAPHVRVNCVAPGWIKTEWGETATEFWQNRAKQESLSGRWGTPRDIANVVAFLCSSKAEFVNGQVIKVNGGFAGTSSGDNAVNQ